MVCSWTTKAVIDYFNRNGSAVFGAAMKMSKAFDMVEWAELFTILIKKNVSFILLRLMLYVYENQNCAVMWAGANSTIFSK